MTAFDLHEQSRIGGGLKRGRSDMDDKTKFLKKSPAGFGEKEHLKETVTSGSAPAERHKDRPEREDGFGVIRSSKPSDSGTGSAEKKGSFGVIRAPKVVEPASKEPGAYSVGRSPFGVVGKDSASSKLVFSNRMKKPVISSTYFLAFNGTGETKVFPALDGMLIGSVWANSTIPDIALSSEADRRQGEIFVRDGKIWFRNISAKCAVFLNDAVPKTSVFEIDYGDILRIHNAFDLSRTSDTVLILVDRIPDYTSWYRIQLPKNANETVQLTRDGDPAKESVFFSCVNDRMTVSHFTGKGQVAVNGQIGRMNTELRPLDVVSVGDTYFICLTNAVIFPSNWKRTAGRPNPAPVTRAGGLMIHIRERRVRKGFFRYESLLKDIRLNIPKGSLVLVLGGSGAGKTTFINAVMGYEPADGVIRYDNIDIYKEYEKMKYAIGYVQQEDLLRRTDVVADTLKDSARMHLACSKEEQEIAVSETMKLLGLEKEQDKLVGQLSGGQRKRLSIGVEYVGEPLLFFLDEPDSGLDGSNADNMWDIVRKIADTGKIVMVISHIPDRAFNLFDRVVILAKDSTNCGRLAFTGTPQDACAFFGTERLEDIVKKINRTNEGGEGRADEFISRFEREGYGHKA